MLVSHKCQYALRALFELAKRNGEGPIRIADIAERQAIPVRFLEVILSQLKQGGFVASQRGAEGGYWLARDPDQITVGDVIRFVEGAIGPVACVAGTNIAEDCQLAGDCVFLPMWQKVKDAMSAVYDGTTLADLVREDSQRATRYVPAYTI